MVLASWNTTKLGPHHWPSSSAKGDRPSNANSLTTWFGLVTFHTHSLCLWRKMFNLKSSVSVLYLKTKVEKGTLNTNTQSQEAAYWKIQDSHKRRWSSREPWSGNHRRGAMVTCNAYLFSLIQIPWDEFSTGYGSKCYFPGEKQNDALHTCITRVPKAILSRVVDLSSLSWPNSDLVN